MLKDPRRRPLPESLRARLEAIPRQVAVCRDRDRLYAAARNRARGLGAEPAAVEHLASCGRCRTLYGTLESAFAEPPPTPSPTLLGRLKTIARRPARLPAWIADGRWATAACIFLTVALTGFAGDSAALFRDSSVRLESRATVWVEVWVEAPVEVAASRGRRTWSGLSTALAEDWKAGRQQIEDAAESLADSLETLYEKTVRTLGSLVDSYRKTAAEGESDGEKDESR